MKKTLFPTFNFGFIGWINFLFQQGNRNIITFITQASGYISIIILSISLIIGSISLLFKNINPVSTYLRRDISIIGGSLAIIHSIAGLFVHLRGKTWLYFLNKTEDGYHVRLDNFGLANYTGLISALIIILLLLTSNDYLLKKLNPTRWKNIQRSSYIMFILILIHCYYYRIGREDPNLIYLFYLPLFAIILIFQMIGVWFKMTKNNL
ncbi:MAG: ferric reductase-like transmembrane domain-containing protein [Bacteroidales bacterium]|nr:ferric reductase-like transmembrane domain-containing protein [Bacteroidales bacterium]